MTALARKTRKQKRPEPVEDIFVATGPDTYLCAECLNTPAHDELRARLGDVDVDVWEEFSDGWLSAPVCAECKLSLPVYVNGNDDADAEEDT